MIHPELQLRDDIIATLKADIGPLKAVYEDDPDPQEERNFPYCQINWNGSGPIEDHPIGGRQYRDVEFTARIVAQEALSDPATPVMEARLHIEQVLWENFKCIFLDATPGHDAEGRRLSFQQEIGFMINIEYDI